MILFRLPGGGAAPIAIDDLYHASVGERLCKEDISFEEILFVSDIEAFTPAIRAMLMRQIREKKSKLVVLAGDINSFLEVNTEYFSLYDQYEFVFNAFCDQDAVPEQFKMGDVVIPEFMKAWVGHAISEQIEKEHGEPLKEFFSFADECAQLKVEILYYSGNHDSMLSHAQLGLARKHLPVLERFMTVTNLHIVPDLELIPLSDDLFITGVHVSVGTGACNNSSLLREAVQSINVTIPHPEKTVFVSHVPGILKFKNLGSPEITAFKKRYQFKYHFHGHCRDYHGVYEEEGVPTRSVHLPDNPDEA